MPSIAQIDTDTKPVLTTPPALRHPYSAAFVEALRIEVATLQAKHPVLADAIGRANALLLDGRLFAEDDGETATVIGSDGEIYTVNGSCHCKAAEYHPENPCKHRIGLRLFQRISEQLCPAPTDEERAMRAAATAPAPTPVEQHALEIARIPPEFIEVISGKPFVKYAGLLQLAQAAGLQELRAEWTANEPELSLARATAIFADGRIFTECGDATPTSGKRVGLHWRRLALTRGKSRALRDALGLGICSVDEMD